MWKAKRSSLPSTGNSMLHSTVVQFPLPVALVANSEKKIESLVLDRRQTILVSQQQQQEYICPLPLLPRIQLQPHDIPFLLPLPFLLLLSPHLFLSSVSVTYQLLITGLIWYGRPKIYWERPSWSSYLHAFTRIVTLIHLILAITTFRLLSSLFADTIKLSVFLPPNLLSGLLSTYAVWYDVASAGAFDRFFSSRCIQKDIGL